MSRLIQVLHKFAFAHEGIRVEKFEPSPKAIEVSNEVADYAVGDGKAKNVTSGKAKAAAPAKKKAKKAAKRGRVKKKKTARK